MSDSKRERSGELPRPYGQGSEFRKMILGVGLAHALVFAGLLTLQGCNAGKEQATQPPSEPTNQAADFERLLNEWTRVPGATSEVVRLDTNLVSRVPEQVTATTTTPQVAESRLPLTNQIGSGAQVPLPQPPAQVGVQVTNEYVVQPGDYPAKIARQFGITVEQLYEANPGLEPRRLLPGQKLRIPSAQAKVAQAAPEAPYPGVLHKVAPGDTLIRIARRYGVSVDAIREENNLKSDRILVGQVLKIPTHKAGQQR